jgi:hypothetical protein
MFPILGQIGSQKILRPGTTPASGMASVLYGIENKCLVFVGDAFLVALE